MIGDAKASFEALRGGGNNQVWLVKSRSEAFVAKCALPSGLERSRKEFAFASFLWSRGVHCIPRAVAHDEARGIGVYAHVNGAPVREVRSVHVDAALAFAAALLQMRSHEGGRALADACEACWTLDAHLAVIGARVTRLCAVSDVSAQARAFIAEALAPAWARVEAQARARADLQAHTPAELRVLSPSDFGFHNALEGDDGAVTFLDFEYAGWDDGAKMLVDFFLQPALPVPMRHQARMAAAIAPGNEAMVLARAQVLFPILKIKWVTIVLNELIPEVWTRRAFAGREDREHRIVEQLARAQRFLASAPEGGIP
jgi:hypothetical protein